MSENNKRKPEEVFSELAPSCRKSKLYYCIIALITQQLARVELPLPPNAASTLPVSLTIIAGGGAHCFRSRNLQRYEVEDVDRFQLVLGG